MSACLRHLARTFVTARVRFVIATRTRMFHLQLGEQLVFDILDISHIIILNPIHHEHLC